MPDFDPNDLNNTLTALRSDTERVGLANAADVRRHGDRRTQRAVAATGVTAALCLVAAAIGFDGLGDGNKRARELPAATPLTAAALLIADELPQPDMEVKSSGEGEGSEPATSCQRGDISALSPEKVWHRGFVDPLDPGQVGVESEDHAARVRQVVVEFKSVEQAAAAFVTINSWFDNCAGTTERGVERYEPFHASGGLAEAVNFSTPLKPDEGHNTVMVEHVSYGIVGAAVTIVSYRTVGSDDIYTNEEFRALNPGVELNPADATLRFALQRIAGERTFQSNAVPRSFQFAEERRGDWVNSNEPGGWGLTRDFALGNPWHSTPCGEPIPAVSAHTLASDAHRTGMITTTHQGGDASANPANQLALYPDEATAKAVAEELVAEYARCATTPDVFGTPTTWTTERPDGPHDVTLAWATRQSDNQGKPSTNGESRIVRAVGIVQRGDAVLFVFEGDTWDGETARTGSAPLEILRERVAANIHLICEVADCE